MFYESFSIITEVVESMKRQKRDQIERAFSKGYQAGIKGHSKSLCPHDTGEAREGWMAGWRESKEDQWDGLNRFAQTQKLINLPYSKQLQ